MNTIARMACCAVGIGAVSSAQATEPNETYSQSTILSPGQYTVFDDLRGGSAGGSPDTFLGTVGTTGLIEYTDDDGSPLGDGTASALFGVPTNSEVVEFYITGYPDFTFFGDHFESGSYSAYVTVYDLFGSEVDDFTVTGALAPGAVDEYSYFDSDYFFGTFDVVIDNSSTATGDVDYFTFTGLTPGTMFDVETEDPFFVGIDTVMALYDDFGAEIGFNDDYDVANHRLSKLSGTVPASGEVTVAVSAYPDEFFQGQHGESFDYDLVLTPLVADLPGDANGDGAVDILDLDILSGNFGTPTGATIAQGDFNGDGAVDILDLDILSGNFGSMASSHAIPEPAALLLAGLGTLLIPKRRP